MSSKVVHFLTHVVFSLIVDFEEWTNCSQSISNIIFLEIPINQTLHKHLYHPSQWCYNNNDPSVITCLQDCYTCVTSHNYSAPSGTIYCVNTVNHDFWVCDSPHSSFFFDFKEATTATMITNPTTMQTTTATKRFLEPEPKTNTEISHQVSFTTQTTNISMSLHKHEIRQHFL